MHHPRPLSTCLLAGALIVLAGSMSCSPLAPLDATLARRDTGVSDAGVDADATDTGEDVSDTGGDTGDDVAVDPLDGLTMNRGIVKRDGNTVVGVSPTLQGDLNRWDQPVGDAIEVGAGEQVRGTFYEHVDSRQGTIVIWLRPEWDVNELTRATLWSVAGMTLTAVGEIEGLELVVPGSVAAFPDVLANWEAGSEHMIMVRWNAETPLRSGEHVMVNVNTEARKPDVAAPWVPEAPESIIIGAASADGTESANAAIEGFTIFRRPLFDGTVGIDVGPDDEVEQIATRTAFAPTRIGSWDATFSMPTEQEPGKLRVSGQAWSHPHLQNLLGPAGFLAVSDDVWVSEGAVSAAPIGPTESVFGHGVELRGGGDLVASVDMGSANAVVVRALVHSSSLEVVGRVTLRDACGVTLGGVTARTGSTDPAAPSVLMTSAALTECTPLEVVINAGPDAQSLTWHQIEVHPVLLENPSFEQLASAELRPEGWNRNDGLVDAMIASTNTVVQSEGRSFEVTSADVVSWLWQDAPIQQDGYLGLGFHVLRLSNVGDPPTLLGASNSALFRQDVPPLDAVWTRTTRTANQQVGVWQHVPTVGVRRFEAIDAAVSDVLHVGVFQGPADYAMDDVYVIALEGVDIGIHTADLGPSWDGQALRIDGTDVVTIPISIESDQATIRATLTFGRPAGSPLQSCRDESVWGAVFTVVGSVGNEGFSLVGAAGKFLLMNGAGDSLELGDLPSDGARTTIALTYDQVAETVRLDVGAGTGEPVDVSGFGIEFTEPPDELQVGYRDVVGVCEHLLELPIVIE